MHDVCINSNRPFAKSTQALGCFNNPLWMKAASKCAGHSNYYISTARRGNIKGQRLEHYPEVIYILTESAINEPLQEQTNKHK